MPSQNSLIRISGRMGNLVYYYRKDRKNRKKYLVRRAPERVSQTTATKRAAADFGTASKTSSLLRKALQEYTSHCYDNTLHYRLNKELGDILRADGDRPAGQKRFTATNMQSLQGFRFNGEANIECTPVIEHNYTGDINITIPNISGRKSNTTHLAIKAIALSLNLAKNSAQQVASNTVIIKHGEKCPPLMMKINRRNTTVIILEIQSFYEVNGQLHPSQDKHYNTLDIIEILANVEEPKEKKYQNKAPHFWLPFATPLSRNSTIRPVSYTCLPEG